uniref:Neprosin PEP catalytic domain-containing protein n=1 Tax=Ananas comosus var. bracteatus TaxID=296719 RepID=A0A6V7QHS1_ANACO|nr:unnamed protein product [Ananas comosus var. bracteatus]
MLVAGDAEVHDLAGDVGDVGALVHEAGDLGLGQAERAGAVRVGVGVGVEEGEVCYGFPFLWSAKAWKRRSTAKRKSKFRWLHIKHTQVNITSNQRSSASIWVVNEHHKLNMMVAGFHVRNDESIGCYNLRCKGFVLVNAHDFQTGDWSLYREDLGNAQIIGYWPKSLFTNLDKSASIIAWGGHVTYKRRKEALQWEAGIMLMNWKEKQHL